MLRGCCADGSKYMVELMTIYVDRGVAEYTKNSLPQIPLVPDHELSLAEANVVGNFVSSYWTARKNVLYDLKVITKTRGGIDHAGSKGPFHVWVCSTIDFEHGIGSTQWEEGCFKVPAVLKDLQVG